MTLLYQKKLKKRKNRIRKNKNGGQRKQKIIKKLSITN